MMKKGMMTETGRISAAVVEFADVQVLDDDEPKVLVRLGEINSGEPVDVAVVVMAPELSGFAMVTNCNASVAPFAMNPAWIDLVARRLRRDGLLANKGKIQKICGHNAFS